MYRILLLLMLIAPGVMAQKDDPIAKNGLPNDVKIIILSSDLNKDNLFSAVGRVLFDNGYALQLSDKNLGVIQSDDFLVKGSIRIRVSAYVEDRRVKVRGRVILPGAMNEELVNQKSFNSIHLTAFSEMDRLSKLIPHTSIEYLP